jgi:glycosyltransferase involved in cell wall biosynthesis
VGGNVELVEDGKTGLLVPVQNPKALADAILYILNNPEQAKEMGKQGKNRVAKDFSLERMVNDYEAIYAEAMKTK